MSWKNLLANKREEAKVYKPKPTKSRTTAAEKYRMTSFSN